MTFVCNLCGSSGNLVPIMSLSAVFTTLSLMVWLAGHSGLSRLRAIEAGLCGLLGAFWGGGLYVLFQNNPGSIVANPLSLVQIHDGPKSVIGAFCGATLMGFLVLRIRQQPIQAYMDAWVPALAIGYAIARMACFINGDDFGVVSEVPWAVQFPSDSEVHIFHLTRGFIPPEAVMTLPVHPTQFYHALLGIIGFIVLLRVKNAALGTRLALALMLYGAGRFVIQFFRGDSAPIWGPFDVNHIAALVMLVGGLVVWRLRPTLVTEQEQPA